MTITATVGSRQGINALKNGVQIGGTTIYAGDGTPAATYVALRIGDLYIDYTNCLMYMATATGSGSWSVVELTSAAQTVSGVKTFTATPVLRGTKGTIAAGATPLSYKVATLGGPGTGTTGGTCNMWTIIGAPSAVGPTPSYVGDILIDTTNGKMYIAGGVTAYTDWKLVTSA